MLPDPDWLLEQISSTVEEMGEPVAYLGKTYQMVVQPVPRRPGDAVPEGLLNAANADWHLFTALPSDFPAGIADFGTLARQVNGKLYTIARSVPQVVSGTVVSLEIEGYRAPPPASATDDPATPGKRGDFLPPDATF